MKLILVLAFALTATSTRATDSTAMPACDDSKAIYKTCGDQKAAFADAVNQAKKDKKILFITFGADWCPWCRSLHDATSADAFKKFIGTQNITMVNVGVSHKVGDVRQPVPAGRDIFNQIALDTKSGEQKIDGIPYLVFFNPAKNKAYFRDSGNLESGDGKVSHDPAKITAAIKEALKKVR